MNRTIVYTYIYIRICIVVCKLCSTSPSDVIRFWPSEAKTAPRSNMQTIKYSLSLLTLREVRAALQWCAISELPDDSSTILLFLSKNLFLHYIVEMYRFRNGQTILKLTRWRLACRLPDDFRVKWCAFLCILVSICNDSELSLTAIPVLLCWFILRIIILSRRPGPKVFKKKKLFGNVSCFKKLYYWVSMRMQWI
jgi:hypothetical protein